jgi:hypothetical protein
MIFLCEVKFYIYYTGIKIYIYSYSVAKESGYLRMATGYVLRGPGSIPGRERFSLLHSVQTDSTAHPASYPVGTGSSLPESNAAGA